MKARRRSAASPGRLAPRFFHAGRRARQRRQADVPPRRGYPRRSRAARRQNRVSCRLPVHEPGLPDHAGQRL